VNVPITTRSILANDHYTGSNHKDIEWEEDVNRQQQVDHEMVVGLNLPPMRGKDMEVVEKLWMELAKEKDHLEAECTPDEEEQEAASCQKAVSSILNGR
jgi:hypothetical protein